MLLTPFYDPEKSYEENFKDGPFGAFADKEVLANPIGKTYGGAPDKFMGDVTGNLSSKRALIEGMEDRGMNKVIKAIVPLSEMFGYMTGLRSMTEGRASFTMEFFRYDIVPNNVAETIIAARK